MQEIYRRGKEAWQSFFKSELSPESKRQKLLEKTQQHLYLLTVRYVRDLEDLYAPSQKRPDLALVSKENNEFDKILRNYIVSFTLNVPDFYEKTYYTRHLCVGVIESLISNGIYQQNKQPEVLDTTRLCAYRTFNYAVQRTENIDGKLDPEWLHGMRKKILNPRLVDLKAKDPLKNLNPFFDELHEFVTNPPKKE